MATCKACGAKIEWVKTPSGKNMPVDTHEFPLIPDDFGPVLGVTEYGGVLRGRTCTESYEKERWVYARLSHFTTCAFAGEFRRVDL